MFCSTKSQQIGQDAQHVQHVTIGNITACINFILTLEKTPEKTPEKTSECTYCNCENYRLQQTKIPRNSSER